jgi:hypothetical protein
MVMMVAGMRVEIHQTASITSGRAAAQLPKHFHVKM